VERDVGENWGERNFLERGFVRLVEDVRGAGLLWSPLMMEWFCPAFLTREREIGERIVGFQERDSLDQTSTFPPLHHRHPVTKTTSAASEEGKRPTG